MKILNVDALAEAKKNIIINGEKYAVNEMTVKDFIEVTKASNEIDNNPNAQEWERIEQLQKLVMRLVPDCPSNVVESISLSQLNAIVLFIRGVSEEDIMKVMKGDDKAGDDEKKENPAP